MGLIKSVWKHASGDVMGFEKPLECMECDYNVDSSFSYISLRTFGMVLLVCASYCTPQGFLDCASA